MQNFDGQVAVITGAGSGFGREFARRGATLGMKLVLADVQDDALAATLAQVEALGAKAIARRTDVAQAAQVEALAKDALAAFGSVSLLFNNAGVGMGGLLWEHSLNDWQWTLGVNLWGVIHGVRTFTPLMLAQAGRLPDYRGHIVNTASMAGLVNMPVSSVYNVSKHGVVSLTESLFQDLSLVTRQISCSVLCPYFIPTGIKDSERNRPSELANSAPLTRSQRAVQLMNEKALAASKLTAERVAEITFQAIREDVFYIYSHPHALGGAKLRMEDVVAARNPSDPFAERPALRVQLEAALHE
jgi:NAD(P)-dependent dehydrogenase (short-subunit alcohol dehydrogenase family)